MAAAGHATVQTPSRCSSTSPSPCQRSGGSCCPSLGIASTSTGSPAAGQWASNAFATQAMMKITGTDAISAGAKRQP